MDLKHAPVFALTFFLVFFATTGKSSALGLSEEAEFRQVRHAIEKGVSLKDKPLDYIAENRMDKPGVLISIENHLDTELKGGEHYEEYGKVALAPPKTIGSETEEIMAFDKKYAAQGAQGMVTYNIKGSKHPIRFAIAFSVPFSYKLSRNWYGLKVIDDDQSLNQKYFLKLYKKDFYDHSLTNEFSFAKRDGKIKIERDPYTITATMTEGKRAVLRVKVTNKGESD